MDKNHQATPNQPADGGEQADRQFAQKLADNLDEIKAVDTAGVEIQEKVAKQPPISEEEARRLLQEEKRLAEIEYKKIQTKNKKTMVVVLVVAAVLCLLGGAFAIAMANRGDEKDEPGTSQPDGGEDEAQAPAVDSDTLVALDLNDELVQRLYGYFNEKVVLLPSLATIYSDGKMSDLQKYAVAVNSVRNQVMPCTEEHKSLTYTDDDGVDHYNTYEAGFPSCISGELIRKEMAKIFGGQYDLGDFEGEQIITSGEGFKYYSDGDEAVNIASGADFISGLDRELYKAERDSNHLYFYEVAVSPCIAVPGEKDCFLYGGVSSEGDYDGFTYEQRYYRKNGELIEELTNIPLDQFSMKDYLEILDRLKWTFTKNSDGNYVFSGLERVEE